ncbi:MAG: DUF3109 family protein [Bacteroidales bacterium]
MEMFQIGNAVVSRDIIEKRFACDLALCKGNCCVYGDAGAPIDAQEAAQIEKHFDAIKPYLQPEAIKAIEEKGFSEVDEDGELVTPLIENRECVYSYFDNGIARCAIEKAYRDGKIPFRKPISCWLYPIRVSRLNAMYAVVLHRWNICHPGYIKGENEGTPVFKYLKEALVARFGQSWYNELEQVAEAWEQQKQQAQLSVQK